MIKIKSAEEIEIIAEGGKILAEILKELGCAVKPGISTLELDCLARELVTQRGGSPSFLNYGHPPFPGSICSSVNEEVVHGVPSAERILKSGDIVGLDIGMKYKNLFTDMAITVAVGRVTGEAERLIKVTKESLNIGLSKIKPGRPLNVIGKSIEEYVKKEGFTVVRALVGHGVGYGVHEDPAVPNFDDPVSEKIILKEGMVLAIEPMVCTGHCDVRVLDDKWTVVTNDCGLAAHFEHTVAVTKNGVKILTK
ncbi:MAG: type I methionyl aminopeptidase [Patescibacteria group bacterium]|nr:type I methionyl aminopeptidase [Patescibacteria group bacterium]MDD5490212.1 type I methionyl aminopeptidase [Patescibacteria group bacterium]